MEWGRGGKITYQGVIRLSQTKGQIPVASQEMAFFVGTKGAYPDQIIQPSVSVSIADRYSGLIFRVYNMGRYVATPNLPDKPLYCLFLAFSSA